MSNTSRFRVSVLALLLLVAWAGVLPADSGAPLPSSARHKGFTISTDPETVILSVVSRLHSNNVRTLELRGNGDLRLSSRPPWRGQAGEYRLRLDYLEMVKLVEVAVSAGLADATVEGIEVKRRARRGWVSHTPPGMVDVAVSLDTYIRDGRTLRDVSNAVSYGARYATSYPEISELKGLVALAGRLDALFYQASGTEPPEPEPDLEFAPVSFEPEAEPPSGSIERRTEAGHYRLAKRHLPLSELVQLTFFPRIEDMLSQSGTARGLILLDTFGIEEGSAEERALLDAVRASAEARTTENDGVRRAEEFATIRAQAGDDAAMRRNLQFLEDDARRLGVVWGQMVTGLGGPDSLAMVKMDAFVERIREGQSVTAGRSFEDPDHTIWKLERAFQEGVNSALSDN